MTNSRRNVRAGDHADAVPGNCPPSSRRCAGSALEQGTLVARRVPVRTFCRFDRIGTTSARKLPLLSSQLFAGDPLLEAIAADGPQRISTFQNQNDPAVAKVQQALLLSGVPTCCPSAGTDGHYGSETAAAVTSSRLTNSGFPPGPG